MNSNISDKDKKDWDEFLLNSDHLPNKDNLEKKNKENIKELEWEDS